MNITVPVAIHLDHGSSFEKCKEAIDAGFTSVMIDASHHPFEENVEITKKVVEYAHAHKVFLLKLSLEQLADKKTTLSLKALSMLIHKNVKHLVEATGIDCLAPALGSVHGPYKGEPNLRIR